MYQFDRAEYNRRMKWFIDSRFGMFIHFGLYSIPARGEWVRSVEKMPEEKYLPFFDEFNPDLFDAKEWAKIAKQAGMKYAVLTAKHHDGFCLFDSAFTDFKSTNTHAKRDFVREFLDAFRAEGLRVGLYYSLLDWHHPDYPHYGDMHHPMRDNPSFSNEGRDFNRYLDYMHNQVKELCSNYGKIDLLWFDFSYGNMRGEKWRATDLIRMVRSLQPDVLIDNRLEVSGEGFGSLAECNPTEFHGDFVTPEKIIPPHGLTDKEGNPLYWESCITMNNNWGYCATDDYYKPADMLIKKLVECVSKGGNMILNVGPDSRGKIPPKSVELLKKIGEWMYYNSKSIYNCGTSALDRPEFGRITQNGNHLYFHMFENTLGPVPLIGIDASRLKGIRLMIDGSEVPVSTSWVHSDYPEIVFADLGPNPVLPDNVDTVLDVELTEE